MKIKLQEITVAELTENYQDNDEGGVSGFGGKLDIRPPYQREFIYGDKERNAVIDTLIKNFPLNVMYWMVRDDGGFEVIDGQQRTISICQYINNEFSFNYKGHNLKFYNMQDDKQQEILNYKLTVYLCSGTDSERLDWFRTINIAGKELTEQEIRNAVYAGAWTADAKKYFSKTGCPAFQIGSDYLNGVPIRQDYLETAIKWISENHIEEYMAKNQHQPNANELWLYFQNVINWVRVTFAKKRKFMKGVDWGALYNQYKNEKYDTEKIERETAELILDDDVTKKSGIYPYLLTGEEKYLSIRAFTPAQKQKAYERQKGICAICKKHFDIEEMEADHTTPWIEGGKTVDENCQMLCREDNRRKSAR